MEIVISIIIIILLAGIAVSGVLISNHIERKPTPSKNQNFSHNAHIDGMIAETKKPSNDLSVQDSVMTKLPLDRPTDSTNITLIKQSLRAEKLDLRLRYRLLISFGILIITSIIRTALQFGAIGTVLITTPFFISFAWALYSSWRVKRAKPISFPVLQQYMSVIPKNISGHFVKVQAKIAFIREETKVAHITAIDQQTPRITISLHKLKDRTYIYEDNQAIAPHPISIGDTVEIIGEIFLQTINGKKVAVLAAHSLIHSPDSINL